MREVVDPKAILPLDEMNAVVKELPKKLKLKPKGIDPVTASSPSEMVVPPPEIPWNGTVLWV